MLEVPRQFSEAPLPRFGVTAGPVCKPENPEDFRKDHRTRLRNRFMQAGAAALPDYELLELVPFVRRQSFWTHRR